MHFALPVSWALGRVVLDNPRLPPNTVVTASWLNHWAASAKLSVICRKGSLPPHAQGAKVVLTPALPEGRTVPLTPASTCDLDEVPRLRHVV